MSNKQKFQIDQVRHSIGLANSEFHKTHKWYISAGEFEYLHNDCVVRTSTYHNGAYTGYYKTREDARETLRKFKSLQSFNKKVRKCRV